MATSQSAIKYSDSTMERAVDSCNYTFVPRSYHIFSMHMVECPLVSLYYMRNMFPPEFFPILKGGFFSGFSYLSRTTA